MLLRLYIYSLACLALHLWIQNFFILKFLFNAHFKGRDATHFRHETSDYSAVSLPLFLVLPLVVLPEVLIGSENREFKLCHGAKRSGRPNNVMGKTIDNSWTPRLEIAIPLMNLWPDRQETNECSFLKLNNVLSVSSATLSMDYNRVPKVVLFRLFLSLDNLFQNTALVIFWRPIQM